VTNAASDDPDRSTPRRAPQPNDSTLFGNVRTSVAYRVTPVCRKYLRADRATGICVRRLPVLTKAVYSPYKFMNSNPRHSQGSSAGTAMRELVS